VFLHRHILMRFPTNIFLQPKLGMVIPEIGIFNRTTCGSIVKMEIIHPVGDKCLHPIFFCPAQTYADHVGTFLPQIEMIPVITNVIPEIGGILSAIQCSIAIIPEYPCVFGPVMGVIASAAYH
jgi:hypothetical protein